MTVHPARPGKARLVGRFLWHYLEMVIAMSLGMVLLGMLWDAILPRTSRPDIDILIMAADMTIGMAAWMVVRRHSWPAIGEMSLAMTAPFLLLLVPYWLGALSGHLVMSVGHAIMLAFMALAMIRRHTEYTHHPVPIRARHLKAVAVVLTALALPATVAAVNAVGRLGELYQPRTDTVEPAITPGKTATHDPAKPTVALIAATGGTNVADLLGSYEVMARTGRLNLYTVSTTTGPVPLTGGLDLVPDTTIAGLTRLLADHHDRLDAVVVPALQRTDGADFAAITTWLRQQSSAGTLLLSVCAGARTLAAAGLLDDRPATSHWLGLSTLRADFPRVHWTGGQRYIDDGNLISTAGVLSGIDGTLRLLERLFDTATARRAAQAVHWRHCTTGRSTAIPVSRLRAPDLVVVLNASYQTKPSTLGIQLSDGVGELELASVFITYTEQSMVGRTVAVGDHPIRSAHGLTFLPRTTLAAAADDLDRLLVPGHDAARLRAVGITAGLTPTYLHSQREFAFDPILRDIARTYDVQSARFAAKSLEYPVLDVELTGSAWPWPATLLLLGLALLGAAVAVFAMRLIRRLRTRTEQPGPRPAPVDTSINEPAHAR